MILIRVIHFNPKLTFKSLIATALKEQDRDEEISVFLALDAVKYLQDTDLSYLQDKYTIYACSRALIEHKIKEPNKIIVVGNSTLLQLIEQCSQYLEIQ